MKTNMIKSTIKYTFEKDQYIIKFCGKIMKFDDFTWAKTLIDSIHEGDNIKFKFNCQSYHEIKDRFNFVA